MDDILYCLTKYNIFLLRYNTVTLPIVRSFLEPANRNVIMRFFCSAEFWSSIFLPTLIFLAVDHKIKPSAWKKYS